MLKRPRDNSLLNNKWKRKNLPKKLLKRLDNKLKLERKTDLTPPTKLLPKLTLKPKPPPRSSPKQKPPSSKY